MNQQDRNELITRIDTNVEWLMKIVGNHLQHHSKLLFWGLGIVGMLTVGLILALVSLVLTQ